MQVTPSAAATRDDLAQPQTASNAKGHRPSKLAQVGMLWLAGGQLAQAAGQPQGIGLGQALPPARPNAQSLPTPHQGAWPQHPAFQSAGAIKATGPTGATQNVSQDALAQDPLLPAAALFAMPDAVLAEASKNAFGRDMPTSIDMPAAKMPAFAQSASEGGQHVFFGEVASARAAGEASHDTEPTVESRRHLQGDSNQLARRQRRGPMRRETQRYELVLSRYNEKLEWLRDLPDFWRITIYNTGSNDIPNWSDRPLEVLPLQNQEFGREGYAYAHHISTRYATLADYTVFSQAAPFEHNPNFGSMLHHPAMLTLVQAMSTMFTDTIPPRIIRDRFSPDPWFRPDKFSVRTMDSLFFEDCCIYTAGLAYAARFNVTEGSNLVNHLLSSIGLPDYIPEESEVGVFPYGGMFGVAKRQIQQHPRDVYQRLVPKLLEHIQVGYIMERTWLILFGGKAFLE